MEVPVFLVVLATEACCLLPEVACQLSGEVKPR